MVYAASLGTGLLSTSPVQPLEAFWVKNLAATVENNGSSHPAIPACSRNQAVNDRAFPQAPTEKIL